MAAATVIEKRHIDSTRTYPQNKVSWLGCPFSSYTAARSSVSKEQHLCYAGSYGSFMMDWSGRKTLKIEMDRTESERYAGVPCWNWLPHSELQQGVVERLMSTAIFAGDRSYVLAVWVFVFAQGSGCGFGSLDFGVASSNLSPAPS